MPSSSKNKDLRLAVLVAAIVAAAGFVPLAYHYGNTHRPVHNGTNVAGGPAAPAPAPEEPEAAPPAPPGAEVVPPEESESDRGPAAASPAGPTMSFGHAAGLHQQPDPMHLSASAAYVVDEGTGQVLVHKNENVVLPIASLTKLMTTMLVLEAKQPMDQVLTITEDDVDHERHSRSRLKVGTSLTREEALRLALMSSENRAAHALGRNYPGGLPKLVEAMNAKAKALGMTNTTYVDPTGLSNRNQSTAHDLSLLVAQAAKNPVMREFSTTPAHLATLGGRTLQYRNSNRLVRNSKSGWDIALQKTGYIVEAGHCLTMATKVGGHDLVMVLLDSDSNGTRVSDAQRLRKTVVAQNGWQDQPVVVAKASSDEPRDDAAPAAKKEHSAESVKVAAKSHKHAKAHKHVAKAEKADKAEHSDKKEETAKSSKSEVKALAAKKDEAKKGRVNKTFVASHGDHKG